MNKIVIIVLLVVGVGLGAGGALFLKLPKGGHAAEKEPPTHMLSLEERTINLADKGESHYLKLSLALEMMGKGSIEEFAEEKKPLLMDRMISVVSSYRYETLLVAEGKEKLKKDMVEALNKDLEKHGWTVKEVLFSDFVME
jgi:flagellar basal body-associated protein FliL